MGWGDRKNRLESVWQVNFDFEIGKNLRRKTPQTKGTGMYNKEVCCRWYKLIIPVCGKNFHAAWATKGGCMYIMLSMSSSISLPLKCVSKQSVVMMISYIKFKQP
jgi:hypothetical protein